MNNFNGKRGLEGEDDQQPDRKRPALASVIVEALKVDSLQRLCSSLEPILRRVVSEEVERALAKLGATRLGGRSPPKQIEGSDGKSLQLHFKSRVSLPLFTGGKVEGEHGAAIHIVLLDAKTGHVVTSGLESSLKLDVLVLEGDFNNEDDEEWTQEEFENHVVKEREGKRPLLTGDLQVTLKEGVGTLGDLTFTDNSSWIRSRKFRLGLKVASGFGEGKRIREGKTEAFTVRDHRGELYKKHYPPALNDEVWRLEKIGKDGSFHKRLNHAGIISVQDFLRQSVRDRHGLRNILGTGMSNKMWDALIEHANTCVLTGTMYVYYSDETKNTGVLFNNIYELCGLIIGQQYYSSDCLSESQKVYVDTLVKKAYENWNLVTEYDRETFVSFAQQEQLSAARNEPSMVAVDFSGSLDHHVQHTHQQQPVLSGQSSMAPVQHDGYNNEPSIKYHTSFPNHLNGASFLPHDHIIRNPQLSQNAENDYSCQLAPSPTETSTTGIQPGNCSVQPYSLNLFNDWSHNRDNGVEEFLSEEEIRIKSHEMLENEDMQQLLRIFSMGGQSSLSTPEDGFSFPSYMPSPSLNYTLEEDRGRPGKAVVGWLKIKAAMRWGFFIRKKAAEKRARLVELDDE